jgi:polar amino acid transport system permease protein
VVEGVLMHPTLANYLPVIFSGLLNTFILALGGIGLGTGLGMLIAFIEAFSPRPVLKAVDAVVKIVMGVPILVIFFIIFFGLPSIGIQAPPIIAAVLGLGLRSGAYQSQLLRGVINSLSYGQLEAAYSIGLTRWKAFTKVILPQALRLYLPGWVNEFTIVLKDTSIAYAIGVTEIFTQAVHAAQVLLDYLGPLTVVALTYFIICYTASHLINRLYLRLAISGMGIGGLGGVES